MRTRCDHLDFTVVILRRLWRSEFPLRDQTSETADANWRLLLESRLGWPSPHETLSIFCGRPSPSRGRLGRGVPDLMTKLGHSVVQDPIDSPPPPPLSLKFVVIWNSPVKSIELPHNVKADIDNGFCTSISHCFSNFLVSQFLLDLGCLTEYWCETCKHCVKLTLRVGAVLTLWGRWSISCRLLALYIRSLDLRDYFRSQGHAVA